MTLPLDVSRIDTVLLDMDGTLLDLRFDNFFWQELIPESYARQHGLDAGAAREHVFAQYRRRLGTLDWYCLDHWSDALGIDIPALKREHLDKVGFLPGVREFLRVLRERGLRTVIATNAHGVTLELKLSVTGLAALVDDIHSSHSFGAAKEEPDFWSRFEARVGLAPARALFLDDNPAVLAAARAHGIGQVLAVRRPDSTQPPGEIPGFDGVDGVGALIPLFRPAPPESHQ